MGLKVKFCAFTVKGFLHGYVLCKSHGHFYPPDAKKIYIKKVHFP